MPIRVHVPFLIVSLLGLLVGCGEPAVQTPDPEAAVEVAADDRIDVHSHARPAEVAVEHLDLDLTVDFAVKRLAGHAVLELRRDDEKAPLRLDTRDLDIDAVWLLAGESSEPSPAEYRSGDRDDFLGRELIVELEPDTTAVKIDYATRPEAAALQWLEPHQTASGKPFMFSQSQAILARTWIPCQDTPAVRITYDATIRVPDGLMAVMSAENGTGKAADGVYRFTMPQPIPSYLLALAVGELAFEAMSERTGVYAEPSMVERAAWEFAETEQMMEAAERLYGPYRWGRYDILVLPPSFPFGGMENPRLTFATPTIIAGDRSLVALIAHELAHSWSGNLVTNATWNDFWLNEGFTVYLERRIMEEIYGDDEADMLSRLGMQDLEGEIDDLGAESADTHLFLDLAGRDPDDGMTDVAYEKGYFFLRHLEETLGREKWDAFLRSYFDRNAFQSLTTAEFVDQLQAAFPDRELGIDRWIYGSGLPENTPQIESAAFDRVDAQLAAWTSGTEAGDLQTDGWGTHEWLHFLRGLPEDLEVERMAELDAAFGFTGSGNAEIKNAWFQHAIEHRYQAAYPALEDFLNSMGRRKFLRPLYERLVESGQGDLALEIYAKARPGYHSVSTNTLDPIVGWQG